MVQEELKSIKEESLKEIEQANDLKELNEVKIKYLGKKGELTQILRNMGNISPEERPKLGASVNIIRDELEKEIDQKEKKFNEEIMRKRL